MFLLVSPNFNITVRILYELISSYMQKRSQFLSIHDKKKKNPEQIGKGESYLRITEATYNNSVKKHNE